MKDYIFEHAECLRHNTCIPDGPGGVAIIVQRCMYLRRCDMPLIVLNPGSTLFTDVGTDLPALVDRHLWGPASASELRQAVAWHLGESHDLAIHLGSPLYDEAAINEWLDDHVAFAVGALPEALHPNINPGAICPNPRA